MFVQVLLCSKAIELYMHHVTVSIYTLCHLEVVCFAQTNFQFLMTQWLHVYMVKIFCTQSIIF